MSGAEALDDLDLVIEALRAIQQSRNELVEPLERPPRRRQNNRRATTQSR